MKVHFTPLVVPAPAKVNLFLHITGRRADGYHTLESLFALVDLADTLTLRRRDDGAIQRSNDVTGVDADDDLTVRAARALQAYTHTHFGVDLDVTKRIPIGGGLGGGSSDAASALLALNRLWELNLSRAELLDLATTLGADVPFFVGGSAAVARGIGERLTPVSLPAAWIVIAHPAIAIRTADIFAAPELTRNTASAKIDVFSEGYGHNDLQAATVARAADVGAAIDALASVAPLARMTGSGACAIAWCASEPQARRAVASLSPPTRGFVARTMQRHPLASFA
ncbi:MAG: 4-(cytidine 5'-diphospho)-2-C-methyl-D-erythritol kinase [Betaproteobacteria bacterium]